MAIFDVGANKVVVRVVYDGPGLAGKTTNLQQLCRFFTTMRRSELYSPEASRGRTTYLDWLQIDSGLVGGYALRSHFITVPGQTVLARRRFHLLEIADAVVFVVDSTASGVDEAAPMFDMLQRFWSTRGMEASVVLQANKQDSGDALDPVEVSARLRVSSGIPVVPAQADTGIGVRETAVLAIRAAADRVQGILRSRGIESISGAAETGQQLRARLEAIENERPMSPVEVVLAHKALVEPGLRRAAAAEPSTTAVVTAQGPVKAPSVPAAPLTDRAAAAPPSPPDAAAPAPGREPPAPTLESAREDRAIEPPNAEPVAPTTALPAPEPAAPAAVMAAPEPPKPAKALPAPEPVAPARALPAPEPVPSAVVMAAPESPKLATALPAPEPVAPARAVPAPEPVAALPVPERVPVPREAEPDAVVSGPSPGVAKAEAERTAAAAVKPGTPAALPLKAARPPLPSPEVASGFVWPSATGRDVLRRVPMKEAELREDLQGRHGTADGSGRSDTLIYEAGIWCLKTSMRRRFADMDEARSGLLQLARRKIQLGHLLIQNTVLCVERDPDGAFWLWTVTPWLTTLRGAMTHAKDHRDERRLGEVLGQYADAAIACAVLAARRGVVLDIHPSNFASLGERTYYLDDDIVTGTQIPALGYALLRRVDEYVDHPLAVAMYVEHVERLLKEHLSAPAAEVLDLHAVLREALVRSAAAQEAKQRFLRVVEGLPGARE